MHPQLLTPTLPSGLSFDLLLIEGGQFRMGSSENDPDARTSEKPAHEVQISSFYLGRFPATQELWEAVMGKNPSEFKGERRPVEQVSWYDAVVFCNRLSEMDQLQPCYYADAGMKQVFGKTGASNWELPNKGEVCWDQTADGYRLPTEAEWEYAARGGAQSEGYRYAGSDKLKQVGWYDGNNGEETREVGLLYSNELGLFDMSGNVWEWCWDWYGAYSKEPQDNPTGPDSGSFRVFRGGSWLSRATFARCSDRRNYTLDRRYSGLGFRLARTGGL